MYVESRIATVVTFSDVNVIKFMEVLIIMFVARMICTDRFFCEIMPTAMPTK